LLLLLLLFLYCCLSACMCSIDFHTMDDVQATSNAATAAAAAAAGGGVVHTDHHPAAATLGACSRPVAATAVSSPPQTPPRKPVDEAIEQLQRAAVELDGANPGAQLVSAAKTLLGAASGRSGSRYQIAAALLPRELRPLLSRLAHLVPDAPFRAVMHARKMMSAASLQLLHQTRLRSSENGNGSSSSSASSARKKGSRTSGSIAPGSFLGLLLAAGESDGGSGGSGSGADGDGSGAAAAAAAAAAGVMVPLNDLSLIMQANTFTIAGVRLTCDV
jgi:hypothetical protein